MLGKGTERQRALQNVCFKLSGHLVEVIFKELLIDCAKLVRANSI